MMFGFGGFNKEAHERAKLNREMLKAATQQHRMTVGKRESGHFKPDVQMTDEQEQALMRSICKSNRRERVRNLISLAAAFVITSGLFYFLFGYLHLA